MRFAPTDRSLSVAEASLSVMSSDEGTAAGGGTSAPKLESLAPRYSEKHHGTYFKILKRAIDEQPDVRNIALAGTYGAGKSSVLQKLAATYPKRVIEISLLSLGVKPDAVDAAADGNPIATTTTNRIQKEIVKQLLYQQEPSQAPESRFRRIARFRWGQALFIALVVGLLLLASVVAIGLDLSALAKLNIAAPKLPDWLRAATAYVAVVAAGSLVTVVVQLFLHGRLGLEKVTAGPATITLPPRSSSYFDEYLDEIIYFFETNSSRDIVILEDLDRFDDARIFEALRSLNGMLNAAKQLKGRKSSPRNIRFIYAVRDSVFERLGRDEAAATDEARAELARANRTKFFELVVPVVPFITHKNARDLMHDLLRKRGHQVSKDIIDLAGRYVADMRLIHNIVNEYEVFKNRLLDVPRPVPELDAERLFAMALFKNAHLRDFEDIRHGTSSLDRLYETWRGLVRANLQRLRDDSARLRRRIDDEEAADEQATHLGERLRQMIDVLSAAPRSALASAVVSLDGRPVSDPELKTADFWRNLLQSKASLTLSAHAYRMATQPMVLAVPALEVLLGTPLDTSEWLKRSVVADEASIRRNRVDSAFLLHHSWNALVDRAEFTYAVAGSGAKSFQEWVDDLMPSRLAAALVVNGYITPYFAIHVSTFYGELIRPDAMTYVMRNVDHGTADADYMLDGEDVDAILRDQGLSVLAERSMYNVSILDHLLTERPDDARVVVRRLTAAGMSERAFVDHYMSAGRAKAQLVAELTGVRSSIFTYLASEAPLERDERATLFDVAIAHRSSQPRYELTAGVRAFVETTYRDFPSLTTAGDATLVLPTVRFIVEVNAVLSSVQGLSQEACAALATTSSYRVTAENLKCLAHVDDIALDNLYAASNNVYEHALANISDYLGAAHASSSTQFTIKTEAMFAEVLRGKDSWSQESFSRLVETAAPNCRFDDLDEVHELAWPALVASGRVPATFSNVSSYIENYGAVDGHLAALLDQVDGISDLPSDEESRKSVATSIINAGGVLPSVERRIALALSLKPGSIPTSHIDSEPGQLVGRLIAESLINDDEEAFEERLMVTWSTFEHAIAQSQKYETFVGPDSLPAVHIAALMTSTYVKSVVKVAVINGLDEFDGVPKGAYQAIADSANRGEVQLSASLIQGVHAGGARTESVLDLLAGALDRITSEDLRSILRALGGSYTVIADRGTKHPKVPDTVPNRAILERLKGAGTVSSFATSKDSMLRVSLKQV